ncbi:hypothetical protein VCHA34P129_40178 [Vibrio chagasii]|nr:hypothetical protein VCHA34P129_40178 [Vibrio chagasii]CAH7303232.1 hypothetical protein VCHA52P455_40178 [Vibrio chagasii]
MRDHQRKLRQDFKGGKYGSNERIKESFKDIEIEEKYRPDEYTDNAWFFASNMVSCSALELKALCDLYAFDLAPYEVSLILKIKRMLKDV